MTLPERERAIVEIIYWLNLNFFVTNFNLNRIKVVKKNTEP